jgi:hypothetical protein
MTRGWACRKTTSAPLRFALCRACAHAVARCRACRALLLLFMSAVACADWSPWADVWSARVGRECIRKVGLMCRKLVDHCGMAGVLVDSDTPNIPPRQRPDQERIALSRVRMHERHEWPDCD